MSMRLDLAGRETAALFEFAGGFAGKRVLEVGCGDGRLTWRYADQAAQVVGIDPKADKITRAQATAPPHWRRRVEFQAATLEAFASDLARFDLVILAWSL